MAQQRASCLRSLRTPDARNSITMRKNSLRLPLRLGVFARVILFSTLLLSTAFATRVERQIDSWKPQHYLVTIALDDKLTEITASTRIDIKILKATRVID